MGFDLLTKLRHLFKFGGSSSEKNSQEKLDSHTTASSSSVTGTGIGTGIGTGTGTGTHLASVRIDRKKRPFGNEEENRSTFKYRRVTNTFPKFMPLDNDYDVPAGQHREPMTADSKRLSAHFRQNAASGTTNVVDQTSPSPSLPPLKTTATTTATSNTHNFMNFQNQVRRSMFDIPQTKVHRVRNKNVDNIVIDLSDDGSNDDEDDIFGDRSQRNNHSGGTIPKAITSLSRSSVRPNLLYSEALRLGTTNGGGMGGVYASENFGRPMSSLSSTPAPEVRINGHGHGHGHGNWYNMATDNVIMYEVQREDRNQYINFINQLTINDHRAPQQQQQQQHKQPPPSRPTIPPPLQRIKPVINRGGRYGIDNNECLINVNEYEKLIKGATTTNPTTITTTSTINAAEAKIAPMQRSSLLQPSLLKSSASDGQRAAAIPRTRPERSISSASSLSSTISSTTTTNSSSVHMIVDAPKTTTNQKLNKVSSDVITLDDDDDDDDDDDVTIDIDAQPSKQQLQQQQHSTDKRSTDLSKGLTGAASKFSSHYLIQTEALQRRIEASTFSADNFMSMFNSKYERLHKEVNHCKNMAALTAQKSTDERRAYEQNLRENLSRRNYQHKPLFVLDTLQISEEEDVETELPPLTDEHLNRYHQLIQGPGNTVLVSKFNLNITRNDISTLVGNRWLNDEVINFYMNLLTERSEIRKNLPSVYAMNTFFVPRLLQNGHGAVKRWTRKVNIFDKDIIPVPVHVGGVHWCMAIIHMKNKTIFYYDSMGNANPGVLDAIERYLREESLDKRKQPFDTSGFKIESVQNVPHQLNGSDCGVFSCMFAEYITRNKPLSFSQDHMEYFRKKMTLEICAGELWL